jgi:hypothetical protein
MRGDRPVTSNCESPLLSDAREQTGSDLVELGTAPPVPWGRFEFERGGHGPGIRTRGLTVPNYPRGIARRLDLSHYDVWESRKAVASRQI